MPATVIAEHIGWTNSIRVLRDRVGKLRPLFTPPDPCQRTCYFPGELAQFDLWQPDVEIAVGHGQAAKLWGIAGVCEFSRFLGGWMIPSRQAHDVLAAISTCSVSSGRRPGGWCGIRSRRSASGGPASRCSPRRSRPSGRRWGSVPSSVSAATGGERADRAGQPLLRDELLAGPPVRVGGRLQRPVHRLAAASQRAHPRHHQAASGRGDLRGARVDAGVPRWCCRTRRCASVWRARRLAG
jgi:hypothetical protein